jgi:hypothetical protein
MRMHNEFLGDYTIENHVVEFDPERRIVWEPVRSATSREEAKSNIGHNLHHRWGYELQAESPTATLRTEFFDCSRSTEDWQEDLKEHMQGWLPAAMAGSLEKIEEIVQGPQRPPSFSLVSGLRFLIATMSDPSACFELSVSGRISASPAELSRAFLEGAGRAVLADGGHAHDHLGAHFDRLASRAEGSEVGRREARLDRVELDTGQCLGVLDGQH